MSLHVGNTNPPPPPRLSTHRVDTRYVYVLPAKVTKKVTKKGKKADPTEPTPESMLMYPRGSVMDSYISAYIRVYSNEYTRIRAFCRIHYQMHANGFTLRNRIRTVACGIVTVDPGGSMCMHIYAWIRM
jgi:hypothetical protein